MLKKHYSKTGRYCRVTFDFLPGSETSKVSLCGDFNDWNPNSHPMKRRRDGRFSITVSMEAGSDHHFKYLLDEERWENDLAADSYERNSYGSDNSVVHL